MYTRLYKVITIYGGCTNKLYSVSPLDMLPGYLHMHVIDRDLCNSQATSISPLSKDNILYQWGNLEQLTNKTRRVQVLEQERKLYGNIGIGSAARGSSEKNGDFCGGGEGFIYNDNAFRVTKGNRIAKMQDSDGYWILQLTSFINPLQCQSIKNISSRNELIEEIINFIGENIVFVACFDARFKLDQFAARSNGIYPDDYNPNIQQSSFFGNNVMGGHIIGDSNNPHDMASVGNQSTSVSLIVEGDILIQPIAKIMIADQDDPHNFREIRYQNNKQVVYDTYCAL